MKIHTNWGLSFEEQIKFRAWPEIAEGSYLLDVVEIAISATEDPAPPQAIAAVMLWQQLAEQLLLVVEYWCYYEKALAIYPTQISYVEPKRLMFGQLLQRFEHHQDFPGKGDLIRCSSALNSQCRIPIAHRLSDPKVFATLNSTALAARMHFSEVQAVFRVAQSHFMQRFDVLAARTGIQDARGSDTDE